VSEDIEDTTICMWTIGGLNILLTMKTPVPLSKDALSRLQALALQRLAGYVTSFDLPEDHEATKSYTASQEITFDNGETLRLYFRGSAMGDNKAQLKALQRRLFELLEDGYSALRVEDKKKEGDSAASPGAFTFAFMHPILADLFGIGDRPHGTAKRVPKENFLRARFYEI